MTSEDGAPRPLVAQDAVLVVADPICSPAAIILSAGELGKGLPVYCGKHVAAVTPGLKLAEHNSKSGCLPAL